MAFNPNAIFISPSSLSDFDKCPQLYYYRYVYRTPRGLKVQQINPPLALGTAVHDTIEMYLKYPPTERTKDLLDNKLEFAWSNLTGEKGGFTSAEVEDSYKQRAVSMLARFWQNQHFREAIKVEIPSFCKADLGDDLILTGKLDWIEKEGETYHLIDFKTGKEERDDSQQLPIYQVLVGELFKGAPIKASYWYLDSSDEFTDYNLPDPKETLAMLKQKGEIIKMARATNSFRCQSGTESCWACRDMKAIVEGKGKLVTMDPVGRKQEVYILAKDKPAESGGTTTGETPAVTTEPDTQSDLPF